MNAKKLKIDSKAKRVAVTGVASAVALILGYVEFLIPINLGIPGIKLGLANLAVLFILMSIDLKSAVAVATVKVIFSSLLFGNFLSFCYSLIGAALSLCIMALLKKTNRFGTVGISIAGGVAHNIGQLTVAVLLTTQIKIALYLPVLLITGALTGALIGLCLDIILKRTLLTNTDQ